MSRRYDTFSNIHTKKKREKIKRKTHSIRHPGRSTKKKTTKKRTRKKLAEKVVKMLQEDIDKKKTEKAKILEVEKNIKMLIKSWNPFPLHPKRKTRVNFFDKPMGATFVKRAMARGRKNEEEKIKEKKGYHKMNPDDKKAIEKEGKKEVNKMEKIWKEARDVINAEKKKHNPKKWNKGEREKVEHFFRIYLSRIYLSKINHVLKGETYKGDMIGYDIDPKTQDKSKNLSDYLTLQWLLLEFLYTKTNKKMEFINNAEGRWTAIETLVKKNLEEIENQPDNSSGSMEDSSYSLETRTQKYGKYVNHSWGPLFPPKNCSSIADNHRLKPGRCGPSRCNNTNHEEMSKVEKYNSPENQKGKKIFWIRHCESCANVVSKVKKVMLDERGNWTQALCTQEGILQSIRCGMILKDIFTDKGITSVSIYSSHLPRAVQTAALIRKALEHESPGFIVGNPNMRIPYVKEKINFAETWIGPIKNLFSSKKSSVNSATRSDSDKYCEGIASLVGGNFCDDKNLEHIKNKELNEYNKSDPSGKFRKEVLGKLLTGDKNHAILIVSHGGYISRMINKHWEDKGICRKIRSSEYPNDKNNRDNLSIHMETLKDKETLHFETNLQLQDNAQMAEEVPHILTKAPGKIKRKYKSNKEMMEPQENPKGNKQQIKDLYAAKSQPDVVELAKRWKLYEDEEGIGVVRKKLLTCEYDADEFEKLGRVAKELILRAKKNLVVSDSTKSIIEDVANAGSAGSSDAVDIQSGDTASGKNVLSTGANVAPIPTPKAPVAPRPATINQTKKPSKKKQKKKKSRKIQRKRKKRRRHGGRKSRRKTKMKKYSRKSRK